MPDKPGDSKLAPTLPPAPRKNLETPPAGSDGRSTLWYIPLMLLLLWFWQDQFHQMTAKTIHYSQFKQYLANREVTECEVRDLEITGRIVPKNSQPAASAKVVDKGLRRFFFNSGFLVAEAADGLGCLAELVAMEAYLEKALLGQ